MNQQYVLDQSRLFRLQSKARLAELLRVELKDIRHLLANGDSNYDVFTKAQDNGKPRIIESPKPELKELHQRLQLLFSRIKTPDYLHSGIKGRSYITNAAAHVGGRWGAKTDIAKFYPSTTHRQVYVGLMREFKCSGDVSKMLADLCTYDGHIPTGSPISMSLAFYSHKQTFDQIYLAMLKRGISMTVYVDDLTLSGAFRMGLPLALLKKAISSIGLSCHKTKRFSFDRPIVITGVVVAEGTLRLPNKRHLKIADNLRLMSDESDLDQRRILAPRLLGQINEAASVDERFSRRSQNLRNLVSRLTQPVE